MLRLYTVAAAVALLATGVAGFMGLWGFDPVSGLYHVGVGALFAYAGFFQGDDATLRRMVGGLGVLLLVVKTATVLGVLLAYGRLEHGPVEVTCLVLGVGNVLAARYLPGDTPTGSGRRGRRP